MTVTPTRQDIEALLALTEHPDRAESWWRTDELRRFTHADAEFIAACSPEVIAALCRRALEADEARRKKTFDEALRVLGKTLTAVSDAYDAIEAARDRAPEDSHG